MNENTMNQIGKLASSLEKLSDEVRDLTLEICRAFSTNTPPADDNDATEAETPAEPPKELPPASYEEVRGAMASLSSSGKKAEARALLTKYGVTHLSEIEEADYAALYADAKELLHG